MQPGGRGVGFPGPRWAMPPDSALRHGPSTCKLSLAHMLHIKSSVPGAFVLPPPPPFFSSERVLINFPSFI